MRPSTRLLVRALERAGSRVGVRREGGLVGSDVFVVAERWGISAAELMKRAERQAAMDEVRSRRARAATVQN